MNGDLHAVEQILDHDFSDRQLLVTALTHPSFGHENNVAGGNYQRLEFLGDAVLGMLLAESLYAGFPDCDEGRLSRFRSQMADQETLSAIARKAGVGDYILLGRGEELSQGRNKDSILADVLESLIAAVYLDGGLECARKLVLRLFADRLSVSSEELNLNDSKSALQELLSARRMSAPRYVLMDESGPPHDRLFRFQVLVDQEVAGEGSGRSKKQAQQAAAADALERMQSRSCSRTEG